MPQFLIEAPAGVQPDAKQKMMREITSAIDEAYRMPDVRIWLREYAPGNVAQDGRIGAEPVRPLCFLEAPELSDLDAKSKMAGKIHTAIEEAYHDLANTDETLILMNHYPLENAGWAGRLQSQNPEAVEHIRQLNS
ncbi:tautomerase family protein [Allorhizocola rhizosphaerae]|uniref:tautomerase family protein n=1 Tax=Allorhizocola rhizosphaerae TaxID=1872709 RepID=UPI000E3D6CB0|nr:N-acetylmuramic acid 6-phosphate etherase [Allorhizocola rhizosphaerae]